MINHELCAVMTGDIVGSSKLNPNELSRQMAALRSSFDALEHTLPNALLAPFEIYRGDSFQGVLSKPADALRAVILIRATLRCASAPKQHTPTPDARIAVGIGSAEFLPGSKAAEGRGQAFLSSGPALDRMKRDQRSVIRTPWPEVDAELDTECALLDALVNRWSIPQAQAILAQIRGLTQEKTAEELGISQPAVRQRLRSAGGHAIEHLCRRYERLIYQPE